MSPSVVKHGPLHVRKKKLIKCWCSEDCWITMWWM